MARSKYELKADKELQKEGWFTDYKCRPHRVPKGYQVDYFGMFDILAYDGTTLRFIAIKGHMGIPKALRESIKDFRPIGMSKEIWTYRKNGTVKKEIV